MRSWTGGERVELALLGSRQDSWNRVYDSGRGRAVAREGGRGESSDGAEAGQVAELGKPSKTVRETMERA